MHVITILKFDIGVEVIGVSTLDNSVNALRIGGDADFHDCQYYDDLLYLAL
jgi:hypothetical protein